MKHFCPLLACGAMLMLNSCLVVQLQHQPAGPDAVGTEEGAQGDSGKPTGEADGTAGTQGAQEGQPTEAQQTAAYKLLQGAEAGPLPDLGTGMEPATPTGGYTSSGQIPGGRGIRMGSLAAPEEATGAAEVKPILPNSAERRGLRTPPMPKGLPMDMNGKLTPESNP